MLDRFLTGLRNQGPGAIPALILSLLALGAVAYWLLSRDDDRPTQTAEVVSAPATLTPTTTPDATTPVAPTDSDSDSGASSGGSAGGQGGGGGQDSESAPAPAIPVPSDSGASTDGPPADQSGSAPGGGQRSRADEPPSLEDVQRILQGGNRKPDRHEGSSLLPGLDNLLGDGSGSSDQPPSAASIEDLLDQIRSQNQN